MPHVPTEQLPLLAGVALGAAVLLVMALPLVRDPMSIAALEGATSASTPPGAASQQPPASAPAHSSSASSSASTKVALVASAPKDHSLLDDKDDLGIGSVSPEELAAATTVDQLTRLAKAHPSDERVFGKLARAQAASSDGLAAALGTLKTLFAGSPRSLEDKELQAIVKRCASGTPAVQELAMTLMASGMASVGPDLLYDLTTAPSVAKAAKQKALDLTKKEDVRKLASPALLVALDLRDHPGCGRKDYFAQAEKVGDKRSLGYLTPLVATKGCGFFLDPSDCFACLGNRAELNKAIEAIKAR